MKYVSGFFIALCFTTSKRVRGLLKERFKKCAAEPQSNGIQDQNTIRDPDTSPDFNKFSMTFVSTEQRTKHHSWRSHNTITQYEPWNCLTYKKIVNSSHKSWLISFRSKFYILPIRTSMNKQDQTKPHRFRFSLNF